MKLVSKKNGTMTIFPSLISAIASKIGFTPPTGMSANNVQDAIEEVNKINVISFSPIATYNPSFTGRVVNHVCQALISCENIPVGVWTKIGTVTDFSPIFQTESTATDRSAIGNMDIRILYTGDIEVLNKTANATANLESFSLTWITAN